jgi:hypothetical protein
MASSLFHWAIEHSSPNNVSSPSNSSTATDVSSTTTPSTTTTTPQPIDKKWLDAMLRTDASKMKALIDIFNSKESPIEEKLIVLQELEFFVQNIDNANDLHHSSVNALVPILNALERNEDNMERFGSHFKDVRMRCAWILATALQNNPKLKQQVMELNGIVILVNALKDEVTAFLTSSTNSNTLDNNNNNVYIGSLETLSKILYAISSLLTANKVGQKIFVQSGGFKVLNSILSVEKQQLLEYKQRVWLNKQKTDSDKKNEVDLDYEYAKNQPPVDPNVMVLEDIEEKVKAKAKLWRDMKEHNKTTTADSIEENDPEVSWLRIARRIVFLLRKLIIESSPLKLALVTDQSNIILSLIRLLQTPDNELQESIIQLFHTLVTGEMHQLATGKLKELYGAQLREALLQYKQSLKTVSNDEDINLPQLVNDILSHL